MNTKSWISLEKVIENVKNETFEKIIENQLEKWWKGLGDKHEFFLKNGLDNWKIYLGDEHRNGIINIEIHKKNVFKVWFPVLEPYRFYKKIPRSKNFAFEDTENMFNEIKQTRLQIKKLDEKRRRD